MSAKHEVAYDVLRAIRRIVRGVSVYSHHLAGTVGLTVPQLMVLKALGDAGDDEVTIATLSPQVELSAATLSRIIDRLERAQLVERQRSAVDRRRVRLILSERGRERVVELPTPLEDRFVERLNALPSAKQRELLDALHQVAYLMEAEHLDASPILTPGASVTSSSNAAGTSSE